MARKTKIDNVELKRLSYKRGKKVVGKKPKRSYVLIVCEGERTEPLYFEAIKQNIKNHTLDVKGTGYNTVSLVIETIRLRDTAKKEINRVYDQVWAVFDKDSFSDQLFNSAIQMAQTNNIDCAWSNEAFELWYILHFQYRDTAMSREDYKACISAELTKKMKKPFTYTKKNPNIYTLLKQYGNEEQAIAWAEMLENNFINSTQYAKHNPCTSVYNLILMLNKLK